MGEDVYRADLDPAPVTLPLATAFIAPAPAKRNLIRSPLSLEPIRFGVAVGSQVYSSIFIGVGTRHRGVSWEEEEVGYTGGWRRAEGTRNAQMRRACFLRPHFIRLPAAAHPDTPSGSWEIRLFQSHPLSPQTGADLLLT